MILNNVKNTYINNLRTGFFFIISTDKIKQEKSFLQNTG